MSGLSDIFDFKAFEGKQIWDSVRKKPSRLLTGVDPASTSAWNGIKGSDDKALVDEWGGTTKENMAAADKAGINTGPGRKLEGLAHVVAAYFAGNYAGGKLGGLGGTTPNMNATNPALIDSAMGTPGYGASSAGPGGGAGAGMSLKPEQMMQMGEQFGKIGDQEEPPPEINGVPVMTAEEWARMQQAEGATIAQSSRKVKTPGGLASVQAGDPISENGSHIAAIQQLKREIEAARKRVAALKARKGRK